MQNKKSRAGRVPKQYSRVAQYNQVGAVNKKALLYKRENGY